MSNAVIQGLMAALMQAGVEPNATEIADALWLARHLPVLDARPDTGKPTAFPEPTTSQLPQNQTTPPPSIPPSEQGHQTAAPGQDTATESPKVDVHGPAAGSETAGGPGGSGLAFRSPGAPGLSHKLALSKALRALKRRTRSRTQIVIDEEATVHCTAEEGRLHIVQKPAPERWLEAALVVDEAATMILWQRAIAELQQIFERLGAFRIVHRWGLVTDVDDELHLLAGSRATLRRRCSPREIIDPQGRRLVVVLSDCVAPVWEDGRMGNLLAQWGQHGPVVVLQVLPERLWDRSGLGSAVRVRLQAPGPGAANVKLRAERVFKSFRRDLPEGIAVPVAALEPRMFQELARMLAYGGQTSVKGVLLRKAKVVQGPEHSHQTKQEPLTPTNIAELSPEELVAQFRTHASTTAWKLATFLAAAAPLSLPVMRLIQDQMLPESTQGHLAEFFLGGLLREVIETDEGEASAYPSDPDELSFDFIDGVRDVLLDSATVSGSAQVLSILSDYVEKHVGQSLDFRALLADPTGELSGEAIAPAARPFARIGAQVLARFGGDYTKLAARIQEVVITEKIDRRGEPLIIAGNDQYELPLFILEITRALGKAIAVYGYGLVGGGCQGVDYVAAEAFLTQQNLPVDTPTDRLQQITTDNAKVHFPGGIRKTFESESEALKAYVSSASAVIVVGGASGTYQVIEEVRRQRKLILPIPGTGGGAQHLCDEILAGKPDTLGISRRGLRLVESAVRWGFEPRILADWAVFVIDRTLHPRSWDNQMSYEKALRELIVAVDPSDASEPEAPNPAKAEYLSELEGYQAHTLTWEQLAEEKALKALSRSLPGERICLIHDFLRLGELQEHWPGALRVQAQLVPLIGKCGRTALDALGAALVRSQAPAEDPALANVLIAMEAVLSNLPVLDAEEWVWEVLCVPRAQLQHWPRIMSLVHRADTYLQSQPLRASDRIAADLREDLKVTPLDETLLQFFLGSERVAHRVLGYLACQARPESSLSDALIASIAKETREAMERYETRPVWQLLRCLRSLSNLSGLQRRTIVEELRRMLNAFASASSVDPGRECQKSAMDLLHRRFLEENELFDTLDGYARGYEDLRRRMPSGNERTSLLDELINAIQLRCHGIGISSQEIIKRFERNTDGDRIVALAQAIRHNDPRVLDIVIQSIRAPRASFEQWTALLAAETLVPHLSTAQMIELEVVLKAERTRGFLGSLGEEDSSRSALSLRVLKAIERRLPRDRASQIADGLHGEPGMPASPMSVRAKTSRPTATVHVQEEQQYVLLLDLVIDAPIRLADIEPYLPPSSKRQVLRLSEIGGALPAARSQDRPWRAWTTALNKLVNTLRAEMGRSSTPARCYITGLGALPIWAYLGLKLSTWSPPLMCINRRSDGTWDVLPFDGASSMGEQYFNRIDGLSREHTTDSAGKVAVFVSSRVKPDLDHIKSFMRKQESELAGVVTICAQPDYDAGLNSTKWLAADNSAKAMAELRALMTNIKDIYREQTGLVLFIAGSAPLALMAGCAINPHIYSPTWVPNFQSNAYLPAIEYPRGHGRKLKVFIAVANLQDQPLLNIDEELRRIADEIDRAGARRKFELHVQYHATLDDIWRAMSDYQPQILHLSGHSSDSFIILENQDGGQQPVSSQAFVDLLRATDQSSLDLVVLNSCASPSIADELCRHVDFVLGVSNKIADDIAIDITKVFYGALARGHSIKTSFEQAKALGAAKHRVTDDGLFLRVRDGVNADEVALVEPVPSRP